MPSARTSSAFTLRTAAVGVALSAVVATYSTYAGLKAGGVYWPIITATLAAMGLLRLGRAPTRQEVNVAATAASTGVCSPPGCCSPCRRHGSPACP